MSLQHAVDAAFIASSKADTDRRLGAGLAAIALAIGFNLPFSLLASGFDYPDVLRRPAGEVLNLFQAGGGGLVLTWYGFMLSALALAVIAPSLAIDSGRLARRPGLAIGAAVSGALAGLAQAIGLSRWVFAVPALARAHADPAASDAARAAAEHSFDLLNAWGGVAIGEHVGQLLTAAFVLQLAMMQAGEGRRVAGPLGLITGALLIAGSGEGVAMALGRSGEVFGQVTVIGFLGLALWLVVTGVGLIRGRRAA